MCCGVCLSVRFAPQVRKREKSKHSAAEAKAEVVAVEVTIVADEQKEVALAVAAGAEQEKATADAVFLDAAWDAVGWQDGVPDGEVVDFQVSERPWGQQV